MMAVDDFDLTATAERKLTVLQDNTRKKPKNRLEQIMLEDGYSLELLLPWQRESMRRLPPLDKYWEDD